MNIEVFNGPFGVKASFAFRPDTADKNTILATFKEDEYKFAKYPPNEGDWYIDGGGYIGSTAILYALMYPNCPVVVVEPLPENQDLIRTNLNLNGLAARVLLVPAALGGNVLGKTKIYYRDDSEIGRIHKYVGSGFKNYHESVSDKFVEADIVSLYQLIEQNQMRAVRLLKLDIEGSEYETLLGANDETLKKIQSIVGEYHNIDPVNEKRPRLKLWELVHKNYQDFSPGEEKPTWGPFVFERRD